MYPEGAGGDPTAAAGPRYFVGHSGARHAAGEPVHVVSHLQLCPPGGVPQEIVIAVDHGGGLHALDGAVREALPPALGRELAFSEVARGMPPRAIAARELYFLTFVSATPAGGLPGPHDPVRLLGTLHGPVPPLGRLAAVDGELAVSRSDLLEGFLLGAPFPYPGDGGHADRCWHTFLPGARTEELTQAQGVVIGYPLLADDLIALGPANDYLVRCLLYEALTSLQKDLEHEGVSNPLRRAVIPIPSRDALEAELRLSGFATDGDTAWPDPGARSTFVGRMAAQVGNAFGIGLQSLPPEGTVEDFRTLASKALAVLPGWPSPRATALRQLLRPQQTGPAVKSKGVQPPPSPPPASAARRPRLPASSGKKGKADWMRDFLPPADPAAAPPPQPAPRPCPSDWMRDFDPGAPARPRAEPLPERDQPDWMSDFDRK